MCGRECPAPVSPHPFPHLLAAALMLPPVQVRLLRGGSRPDFSPSHFVVWYDYRFDNAPCVARKREARKYPLPGAGPCVPSPSEDPIA